MVIGTQVSNKIFDSLRVIPGGAGASKFHSEIAEIASFKKNSIHPIAVP